MKIIDESDWDFRGLYCGHSLNVEIERINKANRRKRKALRQQAKAIKRLNEENQKLKEEIVQLWKYEEERDDWTEIEREKADWK